MKYDFEVLVNGKPVLQTNTGADALNAWTRHYGRMGSFETLEFKSVPKNQYMKLTFERGKLDETKETAESIG